MRNRWWVVGPSLAAAAVLLAACGTNSGGNGPAATGSTQAAQAQAATTSVTVKTMHTSKGTVLVNASGMTLYWFAKDTSHKSRCNGSCAKYWPPVLGTSASGSSLPRGFGTIKRADGQTQITYAGHPLYTYAGDTASGQVNGNGLDASGGLWWAVTPTGKKLGSGKSMSTSKSKHKKKSTSSSSGSSGSGW
jgi:predicted lipoprotein with Yx(FWY)xxD motif